VTGGIWAEVSATDEELGSTAASLEGVSGFSLTGRKPESESPQAAIKSAITLAVDVVMSFLKDILASLVILQA
jgi:hypothetical protein